MRIRIFCVCTEYSICDLIFTSSVAVLEAVTWVNSVYMIKSWFNTRNKDYIYRVAQKATNKR